MKTTNNPFALALFALLVGFGCSDVIVNPDADIKGPGVIVDNKYKARESFSYNVDLTNQTSFRLEGINGSVNVNSVSGISQVTVSGEKIASADSYQDAADHLKYVNVEIDEFTDELLVKTSQPKFSDGRGYSVNYTIIVPSQLNIAVDNVNGRIALDIPQNTSAEFSASLVNGSISLQNLTLHNRVATSKSLQGRLGEGQGTITLRTTNGNIDVSGF